MNKIIACVFCVAIFLIPFVARAGINSEVKIFNAEGDLKTSFNGLYPDYQGMVDLTVGDFGKSGKKILISRGSGNSPIVEAYSSGGVFEYLFDVFDANFRGGSFISAGNIDGDEGDEIVVGAGYRGGPQVRVFKGTENVSNFFAYDKNNRAGVKVLVADIVGDSTEEIITGPNLNSDPVINVFDSKGNKLKSKKLNLSKVGGVNLASGDINGDGKRELIVGSGYGNKSQIIILDNDLNEIKKIYPYGDYQGGVNVGAGDLNSDGIDEIAIAPAFHGYYLVRVINANGDLIKEFRAYDEGKYFGGIDLEIADIDSDGKNEIITIPQRINSNIKSEAYKFIEVNLKTQTLSFWQDGRKLDSFLISSGKAGTPTPKGEFKIYNKRPNVRMSWYYGAGNPMNYDLPNVPWVASFKGAYTIHGTYWHHNFGHPMSHGCVNMYTPQAKLIYDWVDIGTPIVIY
ncbi:MAG: L,D-transpeptidase family protein [Candidatus Buchananbacteria bacterium]